MSTPVSVRDDARRAITDAAAAVHRASMAVTWAMPGPHEAAAVAEATEYAMAALKGMQRILTDAERVE